MRCSKCKLKKKDVRRRVDPYEQDVHNKIVRKNLCKACELAIAEEI